MSQRGGYCWRFGEHKNDPCPCGWASDREKASEKASEIRKYLQRQQDDTSKAVRNTPSKDVRMIRYLQGMNDAFCRVTLFLDTLREGE